MAEKVDPSQKDMDDIKIKEEEIEVLITDGHNAMGPNPSLGMRKFQDALAKLGELHVLVKIHFSTQSEKFTHVCTKICNVCNLLAMNLLKSDKAAEALNLLRRSEGLSENNELGLTMTYNNMACYYRKLGHLRSSLLYLEQSLEIESRMLDSSKKAETHLNMCAVLS